MTKFLSVLAAALLASAAVVTVAEAGCDGGYGGGYSYSSYSSGSSNLYARRQAAKARAYAKVAAATKARALAAKRETEASSVAKAPTAEPVKTAALTPTTATVATDAAKTSIPPEVKKVEAASPPAKKICKKFSAAVGGLVETACEQNP